MTDTESNRDAKLAGPPGPAAQLAELDDEQLHVLRHLGRAWGRESAPPEAWRRALPVDPDLGTFPPAEQLRPARFGRFVPLSPLGATSPGEQVDTEDHFSGRAAAWARKLVLGAPLRSSALVSERMRKLVALPVLSADALSSVAYGPEAMLAILVLAGTAGLAYSFPISAAIVFLILAVGVSYRQTIRAYPHGGGSYIVASDNLGPVPGLIAAAGLMTDYVLTVAVSIASGVAAVTSAIPSLAPEAVPIGVAVIVLLLAGNLRGVRQAGALFAAPTYAFIVAMFGLITWGLVQSAERGFEPRPTPVITVTESAGLYLIMRAFSSGATAMTGIEAISNAVPVFRRVEWRQARTTLTWMVGLLIAMFAGIVVLTHLTGVVPSSRETVLSQLAHLSFGSGWLYVFVQAATAAVLLLAANTAYNDFPRVLSLLARDDYAPRGFMRLGDRLAYSNGIILLSVAAALVYVAFDGQTAALIPLYAVGVFLAFTFSQAGMVVHWWRLRDRHWRKSLLFNALGALLSAVVFITAGISKFTSGAWVAIVAVGLFLLVTLRIHRHYTDVRARLRLRPHTMELPAPGEMGVTREAEAEGEGEGEGEGEAEAEAEGEAEVKGVKGVKEGESDVNGETEVNGEYEELPEEIHHLLIVPLATLDLAGMRALAYAASLRRPVLALHISLTDQEADRLRAYWALWGDHLPLEIVVSPYRATVAPLAHYIETLHRQHPDLTLTVILPEVITRHRRHQLLHSRTAPRLRRALRPLTKIVITTVPFHV